MKITDHVLGKRNFVETGVNLDKMDDSNRYQGFSKFAKKWSSQELKKNN